MPSTILSDNGVTSGTSGIKTTGSNDGQLALQTTTAGGATATGLTINNTQQVAFTAGSAASPAITPTGDDNTGIFFPAADTIAFAEGGAEAMRIDSDGDVGIGTSSPSFAVDVVRSGGDAQLRLMSQATGTNGIIFRNNAAPTSAKGAILYPNGSAASGAETMQFVVDAAERMRINSSGYVGIGTSSPSAPLHVLAGNASARGQLSIQSAAAGQEARITFYDGTDGIGDMGTTGSNLYLLANTGYGLLFYTNGASERARISSGGGFSVGTTADPGAGAIYATGNITAYYSDSRLKDVKGNITGALDKVSSLNGVYYTNNDVAAQHGYTAQDLQVGLLAQQVEAVLPEVVKAAPFDLDENGNSKSGENYKTVQYERIIPLLVEAIKELRAEVKALKGE